MIIANPIYDVVFKYLLEDMDIALELLSLILGENIVSLELKPQEMTTELSASSVHILRFDFKAVIKTSGGELKKILIELQKAKQVFDVMRFRRYLGDNYRKEDVVSTETGASEKRPLPIVTVYFLGFPLNNFDNAIVKVNREYRDVTTNEVIRVKEDFAELLTHDSYIIQIRQLKGKVRTALERVLQVFSPEFQTQDKHQLAFTGDVQEPLMQKIVDRLGRAIASNEMRDKMDVEDEIDGVFEREMGKMMAIITEKQQEIQATRQEIQVKDQALETKEQALKAERQRNEALQRQIEELKRQMKP